MDKKTLGAYHVADLKTRREIENFVKNIENPLTRDMIHLHFIMGYSYQKTAQHLGQGMTRDCVFMRITRYLKKC